MTPSKLDLTIWRGTSFELELVSQLKNYVYDPAVHNSPADLKRTHAENLEHYSYVYEYVDFATLYPTAILQIMRPWRQNGSEDREPLMELSLANGEIELTDQSVKIGISADETQEIDWDKGTYKLLLTSVAGKIDGLTYGQVEVYGER